MDSDGADLRVFNREGLPLIDGPTEPNTCSVTQAREGEGPAMTGKNLCNYEVVTLNLVTKKGGGFHASGPQ